MPALNLRKVVNGETARPHPPIIDPMKTSSRFTSSALLLLAAMTGRPVSAAEPGNGDLSARRLAIEQRVLLDQCEKTASSVAEIAVAIEASEDETEKGRMQALLGGYAQWLNLLRTELKKTGPLTGDDREELSERCEEVNAVAWKLVTSDDFKSTGPALVLDMEAVALEWSLDTGRSKPDCLDTKARALFMLDRHDEAIATEEEALKACNGDDEPKPTIEATLASYRNGELPEVSPEQRGSDQGDTSPLSLEDFECDATAEHLNLIAWKILTLPEEAKPHLDAVFALTSIGLERIGAEGQDRLRAQILDTQARATFIKGEHESAIALQKKAIAACSKDPSQKEALETTLATYEAGKLPDPDDAGPPDEDDANGLNEAAWEMLTSEDPDSRNPARALPIASVAVATVKDNAALLSRFLDTKARAEFMLGERDTAIGHQREAVEIATNDGTKIWLTS